MVNDKIVKLIQDTCDSIINAENSDFAGYIVNIHNEIAYNFISSDPHVIEANLLFGSATQNNDLAEAYTMSFVINISSEANGGLVAKALFDLVFSTLTRTYPTIEGYNAKIFFTSPVIMKVYNEIEDNFNTLLTMNGSIDFSKNVVLKCKYEISLNGSDYVRVYPRQPYCMKECVGGNDNNYNTPSIMTFSKQSNTLTINLVVLMMNKTGTTADITLYNSIFNTLLSECYGASTQSYSMKITIGDGTAKTISNLICIRGQHIFDEATGENVLSLQFKVGE